MGIALDEARAAARARRRARSARSSCRRHRRGPRPTSQRTRAHPTTRLLTPRCSRCATPRRPSAAGGCDDCVLVVTLEPCPMCAGAAVDARDPVVVFGAADLKAGALGTLYNLGSDPRLNHAHRRARRRARRRGRRAARGVLRRAPRPDRELARDIAEPIRASRRATTVSRWRRPGGMRERPNRMVSKTIVGQPTLGSNPSPSATRACGDVVHAQRSTISLIASPRCRRSYTPRWSSKGTRSTQSSAG